MPASRSVRHDGLSAQRTQAPARHRQRRRGCRSTTPRAAGARGRTSHGLRAIADSAPGGLAGAELVMHDAVQHAIELRLVGRAVHHREVARVEPVLLRPELLRGRARRTSCRAADTTPTRRCPPARARAPVAASPRCRPSSRRDSRTAGTRRRRCPRPSAGGWRSRICSTRRPFSIASRTRCEPDSAPIHTIRQPAAASACATLGVT